MSEESKKDSNPVYKKNLVLFLDIIGWKETTEKNNGHDAMIVQIQINSVLDLMKAKYNEFMDKWNIIQFSDTIVVCFEVNDSESFLSQVGILIEFTIMVNMIFLTEGVFFRGAITFGDLYYNESNKNIFGPCLNKAYEMESKVAIFPRVVVERQIVEKCSEELNTDIFTKYPQDTFINFYQEIIKNFLDYIPADNTGIHYIDPRKKAAILLKSDLVKRQDVIESIKKQMDILRKKRSEYKEKDFRCKQKINWLISYHNDNLECFGLGKDYKLEMVY